ncbi:MAG: 2-oxoacid:ferredoxin oxidoreductase subunit beta [Candidatus Cloacimonetes bacterium]|nr:2-oxoacid:ferredoxin oxidoreductase subunit beta [Candidatus Cloacimonadota bacterium]
MKKIPQKEIHKYLRHNKKFPHVWCPGCSDGIILGATIRAVAEIGWEKDDCAMVSGIGCSSRMPVYVDFNTAHTLHGRALAYATGIKMAKPRLNVIVVTGDGDASAIGGNHLIHACRRNINLTVICINNNIYGMTGGQYSPTTPHGAKASTMPFGNIDNDFDLCKLTIGAGATFVARTTAYHATEMQSIIKAGFEHNGFAFIEVMAACPVIYGRWNKKGDAPAMMKEMKDQYIPLSVFDKLAPDEKMEKSPRGILKAVLEPEYSERYAELVKSLQSREGEKV